ncbi:TetR/AcrR family transcriptional regulator [Gordonia aichiensis]
MARRSGWGGALPADDDEAAQRIVAAARRIVEETGRAASVSEVTRELQITRQTVYRYFPGVEALTNAVAIDIGTEIGEMLTSQLAGITDPVDAIVELLASAIETVRANPVVADGLTRSAPANPVVAVTGSGSREFTVDVLRHLDVDWAANGIDDDRLGLVHE